MEERHKRLGYNSSPDVYADETAIDQVIVNFVNNAVKHAPGSKDITVTIERNDVNVRLSVMDNGPGILPDQLSLVFKRYTMPERRITVTPVWGSASTLAPRLSNGMAAKSVLKMNRERARLFGLRCLMANYRDDNGAV